MSILLEDEMLIGSKGGSSSPSLSSQEKRAIGSQTDIANWQWQQAQDQQAIQQAMLPFYLQEAGYEYSPYDRGGEHANLTQQRQAQTDFRGSRNWKPHEYQAIDDNIAKIDQQLSQIQAPPTHGGQVVDYGGASYLLNKKADPLEETNKQIAQLAGDRQLKALKGELDIDPAVTQDLERQQESLHEQLVKQLGPGYANTDAGQRALSEFERNANTLRYQVRHGEMSAANALQQSAENAYRGNRVQTQQSLQGYSNFPASASATASGAAQGFSNISNIYAGNRQLQDQAKGAQAGMWGNLAGGAMGLGAGVAFAV